MYGNEQKVHDQLILMLLRERLTCYSHLAFFPPTVSEKEIKRLYKRFKNLDMDDSGTITASDFSSIPELGSLHHVLACERLLDSHTISLFLAMNPLLPRITAVFGIKSTKPVSSCMHAFFLFINRN